MADNPSITIFYLWNDQSNMMDQPITKIKGIGEKKANDLKKLNIGSIRQLLHHFPRDYETFTGTTLISDVQPDTQVYLDGVVYKAPVNQRFKAIVMTTMGIKDATGSLQVVWFNQPYYQTQFHPGDRVLLKGKITFKKGRLQLSSPKVMAFDTCKVGSFIPVYALTQAISQKNIRQWIVYALDHYLEGCTEFLPELLLKTYDYMGYQEALETIHRPKTSSELQRARVRLIFNEFFIFQLSLLKVKQMAHRSLNTFKCPTQNFANDLRALLPFQLTDAQNRVLLEILEDLQGPYAMNRLIQGDVGSGKTIVGALALTMVVEQGYQGAMMAPTEILAKQHFDTLSTYFEPLGISIACLTGRTKIAKRREILKDLKNGHLKIVVGTHALIQERVQFKALALVITDEQHRFGVKQRALLTQKGPIPHVMVMSATPIPRTLGLIVYGDMDISIIEALPKGRQPIKTHVVTPDYRERIYDFIEAEISKGRQGYIICPLVSESDHMALTDVTGYAEKMGAYYQGRVRVGCLHGQMNGDEKDTVMADFVAGAIDLLVATTVVEVGVNVQNASIMVIEDAERYGLAALHQLRGRVGRGAYASHCILISEAKSQMAKERLGIMKTTQDGFVIADCDLKHRGPGDAFGTHQHGLPMFKLGHIVDHFELLKQASSCAKDILEMDSGLERPEHRTLWHLLESGGLYDGPITI